MCQGNQNSDLVLDSNGFSPGEPWQSCLIFFMEMNYITCPLNKNTFKNRPIREYVESNCTGKVLNLFAGETILSVDEVRNDIDITKIAEYRKDAFDFVREWAGYPFDTIILDPPYSYRKSMEFYNGFKNSKFKLIKDHIPRILNEKGRVITFGYQSINMGKSRGFKLIKLCVFSHGGAIHDTLCSIEERN